MTDVLSVPTTNRSPQPNNIFLIFFPRRSDRYKKILKPTKFQRNPTSSHSIFEKSSLRRHILDFLKNTILVFTGPTRSSTEQDFYGKKSTNMLRSYRSNEDRLSFFVPFEPITFFFLFLKFILIRFLLWKKSF